MKKLNQILKDQQFPFLSKFSSQQLKDKARSVFQKMVREGHPFKQMGGWIFTGISGSHFVLDSRSPERNQQLIEDYCIKRSQFIAKHYIAIPPSSYVNQVQCSHSTPIPVQQGFSTPTQVGSIPQSSNQPTLPPTSIKRSLVDVFSQSRQPLPGQVDRNGPPVKKIEVEEDYEHLQQLVKNQEEYIESLERELRKMRTMYRIIIGLDMLKLWAQRYQEFHSRRIFLVNTVVLLNLIFKLNEKESI
ncbi:hypothetical protein MP228_001554 [Amoeboaphelidium protococcarum]|nr:hypothetical protein MP228_001554 [Amoeboaphelidium protococcarum]